MKILLIRANRNEVDEQALGLRGIDTVSDPYLEISQVDNPKGAHALLEVLQAPEEKWLVITSLNAAHYWMEQIPPQALENAIKQAPIRFAALGTSTESFLRDLGARNISVPDSHTSVKLADLIAQGEPMPVVVPSGSISMKSIPTTLIPAGFTVHEEVFYQTAPTINPPPSAGKTGEWGVDAVLFRSPSAVRIFLDHNPALPDSLGLIAGGRTTASQLRSRGYEPDLICVDPEPNAIAECVERHYGGN